MIRTVADFETIWRNESEMTAAVLATLTDASLGQRGTPKDRTLGDTAWHITTTIPEMMGLTGLAIEVVEADAPCPASAKAIHDAYVSAAGSVLEQVCRSWTDETLAVEDDMYGERWPRGRDVVGADHPPDPPPRRHDSADAAGGTRRPEHLRAQPRAERGDGPPLARTSARARVLGEVAPEPEVGGLGRTAAEDAEVADRQNLSTCAPGSHQRYGRQTYSPIHWNGE